MDDRWLFVVLFLTLFSTPAVCAQTQKEHVAIGIISTAFNAIVFGLLFATVLRLSVVPVMYKFFFL